MATAIENTERQFTRQPNGQLAQEPEWSKALGRSFAHGDFKIEIECLVSIRTDGINNRDGYDIFRTELTISQLGHSVTLNRTDWRLESVQQFLVSNERLLLHVLFELNPGVGRTTDWNADMKRAIVDAVDAIKLAIARLKNESETRRQLICANR